MFIFKDHFADLTAWSKDASVTVAASEVTGTATAQQAWKALTEAVAIGDSFRIDTRFKITDGAGLDDGYLGINRAAAGTRDVNTANWLAIGYSSTGGIVAFHGANIGGTGLTTLLSAASVVKGNYYRAGIVSDGTTVTFWVSNDAGDSVKTAKFNAPTAILRNMFIHFNEISGLSVDKFGIINALEGYNDVNFNERLRFYCYTGGKTENERAYVECPDTYTKAQKHKLAIMTHGSTGTPEDFIDGIVNEKGFRKGLVGAGYVFAVSHAHGNNWGNKDVITDNRLLRDYLQTKLTLYYKSFIMGQSMGGHGACLTALQYSHMFAAIGLVYPSLNLDWQYYALNSSQNLATAINTAYGSDNTNYHRIAQRYNTHDRINELARFPLKTWHGDADVTVGIRHSQDVVNGITALGGTASIVTVAGGVHGAAGCFDAVAMAAFFNTVTDLNQPNYVQSELQGAIGMN